MTHTHTHTHTHTCRERERERERERAREIQRERDTERERERERDRQNILAHLAIAPSIALAIINEYDGDGLLRSHVTHLLPLLLDQLGHCQTVSPREIHTKEERSPGKYIRRRRKAPGNTYGGGETGMGRGGRGERESSASYLLWSR